ncbi:MAG TPA: cation-transporting P-type ATPase, partial [Methanoregulaceae archaeon]|nr:cation-transporting P-type ATPase [Methanoregulaceae archaeon]
MDLPETPHAQSAETIATLLSSSPAGLSEEEVTARRERFGRNVIKEEKTSRFVIFLRQFKSLLVYILIIAAVISLLVADFKDFVIILFIILVNSIIGF